MNQHRPHVFPQLETSFEPGYMLTDDTDPGCVQSECASGNAAEPRRGRQLVDPVRPLRVLVADDNRLNQRIASALLHKMGYHVVLANDGREAVSKWSEIEVDLILMDIHMPVVDGFEATRTIRCKEQEIGTRIPIIALTAYAASDAREHCLAAEMDDYVPKPVSRAALQAAIARCQAGRAQQGSIG